MPIRPLALTLVDAAPDRADLPGWRRAADTYSTLALCVEINAASPDRVLHFVREAAAHDLPVVANLDRDATTSLLSQLAEDDGTGELGTPVDEILASTAGLFLPTLDDQIAESDLSASGCRMLGSLIVAMEYDALQAMPASMRLRRNGLRIRTRLASMQNRKALWAVPGLCLEVEQHELERAGAACQQHATTAAWWIHLVGKDPLTPESAVDAVAAVEFGVGRR